MNETTLLDGREAAFAWTEVREALGVPAGAGRRPEPLGGVSTDTRTLKPGDLFFALRGPRFDGHDFVREAVARGAGGVVVRHGATVPSGIDPDVVIRVDDPGRALGRVGGYLRRRWDGRLVAVTGSFGKTTTKEMIGRLLGGGDRVLVAPGTENNVVGVPRLLARLGPGHRFAVVEMGTSRPGEIAHLAKMTEPDVAVITGVGAVHLEGLNDLDGVVREKSTVLDALGSRRIAVLNGDDARVRAMGELARTVSDLQCVYYGFGSTNDVRAAALEADGLGMRFRVEGKPVHLPLLGAHNVMNALAAYAVGRELGVPPFDLRDRMEALAPVEQRMVPLWFGRNLIIDDTYNANPPAMRAALTALQALEVSGRRWLVAGEMMELGEGAGALHREIGKAASDSGIDVLWAVGPLAAFSLEGARDRLPSGARRWFPDAAAAARALPGSLLPGDVVLVKGSRAARLEIVVGALREGGARGGG